MSVFQKLPYVTINFSTAIGAPIITPKGLKLGNLIDFYVDFEESYSQIFAERKCSIPFISKT